MKALGVAREKAANAKQAKNVGVTTTVIVGTATCGVSAGALEVLEAFKNEIQTRGLEGISVRETGCAGRCALEPFAQVLRQGEPPVMYFRVTAEKARSIVQRHIQNHDVVTEWTVAD